MRRAFRRQTAAHNKAAPDWKIKLVCLGLGVLQSVFLAHASAVTLGGSIVQLFEWSWRDVAVECEDWLGPRGVSAVQISPPSEHIQGVPWWTRYQPVSYNLTSRSGTEEELISMVKRCKAAGVQIYADVVMNHMAAPPVASAGRGTGGSSFRNRDFPGYSPAQFHHRHADLSSNCAIDDYSNRWEVQNCDLVALPDLDTASPTVQAQLAGYVSRLADLGFSGVRLDAAKHIPASDIADILSASTTPPDFLVYQEVIRGLQEPITPEEYLANGRVLEFGYPREVFDHFTRDGELQYLKDIGESWGLLPSAQAVVFVDNHDLQRSGREFTLTHQSGPLYELATIFMLAHPYGTPRIMSSYFFGSTDQGPPDSPVHPASQGNTSRVACGEGQPWVCEHRWPAVAAMVRFRSQTAGLPLTKPQVRQGGNLLAFSRGQAGFIAVNTGEEFHGWLDSGLPEGAYRNLLSPEEGLAVNSQGWVEVHLSRQSAVAILAGDLGVDERMTD